MGSTPVLGCRRGWGWVGVGGGGGGWGWGWGWVGVGGVGGGGGGGGGWWGGLAMGELVSVELNSLGHGFGFGRLLQKCDLLLSPVSSHRSQWYPGMVPRTCLSTQVEVWWASLYRTQTGGLRQEWEGWPDLFRDCICARLLSSHEVKSSSGVGSLEGQGPLGGIDIYMNMVNIFALTVIRTWNNDNGTVIRNMKSVPNYENYVAWNWNYRQNRFIKLEWPWLFYLFIYYSFICFATFECHQAVFIIIAISMDWYCDSFGLFERSITLFCLIIHSQINTYISFIRNSIVHTIVYLLAIQTSPIELWSKMVGYWMHSETWIKRPLN